VGLRGRLGGHGTTDGIQPANNKVILEIVTMPLPALSFMGFLQEQTAIGYMTISCAVADKTAPALRKRWLDARNQRGSAVVKAGEPEVLPMPSECVPYLNGVKTKQHYKPVFAGTQGKDWDFKLVEIAKLLAWQLHVIKSQFAAHRQAIKNTQDMREVVELCLPQALKPVALEPLPQSSGLVIKARDSLNVNLGNRGTFIEKGIPPRYGVEITANANLVQVVRYQGRCYLHNGYHRVCGLMQSITHIPCILREATEMWQTGVRDNGTTLPEEVFRSGNLPTCSHFTEGRAYAIDVRKASKIMTVTWSEGIVFDE
jgi:hypothetical protein